MILSNTSYVVEPSSEKMWLFWIRETLIPMIEECGLCSMIKFYHLNKIQEDANETYALQLEFKSADRLQKYNERFKASFDLLLLKRFGNSVIAFRTQLDELYRSSNKNDE